MEKIKVVKDGEVFATYDNVLCVETKWVNEFNWYGRILHLVDGNTATFKVPVEIYAQSNIGYVSI